MEVTTTIRPFITAEFAGTLLFKKFGARFFLPSLVISWGIICTFQGQNLSVLFKIIFCQTTWVLNFPLLQDL